MKKCIEARKAQRTADAVMSKLLKVQLALFPKPRKSRDGSYTSSDAYYNLEGALYDLRKSGADRVCIHTVARVVRQLAQAKHALEDKCNAASQEGSK